MAVPAGSASTLPGVANAPAPASPQPPAAAPKRRGPVARLRQWWQARLPLTDTWVLGQRNIYILPTRAGFTFAGTLVVMLLAAINYQLNLGYALTFLLAGAALVSMHMTHGNLRRLTLHLRPTSANFAGQNALLEVVITNPGADRHGLQLQFEDDQSHGVASAWCDAPAGGQVSVQIGFVPGHRGWHAVPTLRLATVFPFGLFRAWTVWRPAARVLAWPIPETPAPPLPLSASTSGDDKPAARQGGSEWDGVRPWRRGDTMRQVVWKKVARSGEMVSRETAGTATRELWLDWAETSGTDKEKKLSRLTAWVLRASQEGLDMGLRLPHHTLPAGQGDAHRRAALDALAQSP
jgi:uncharacterized protein (DUF58 family)